MKPIFLQIERLIIQRRKNRTKISNDCSVRGRFVERQQQFVVVVAIVVVVVVVVAAMEGVDARAGKVVARTHGHKLFLVAFPSRKFKRNDCIVKI